MLPILDDDLLHDKQDLQFLEHLTTSALQNEKRVGKRFRPGGAGGEEAVPQTFFVVHTCGEVEYSVQGWVQQDRENLDLPAQVAHLLAGASSSIGKTIGQKLLDACGTEGGAKKKAKKGVATTVSSEILDDLSGLMKAINSTTTWFVRCLRPNAERVAEKVDSQLLFDQLQNTGMFDFAKLKANGYPNQQENAVFFAKHLPALPLAQRDDFAHKAHLEGLVAAFELERRGHKHKAKKLKGEPPGPEAIDQLLAVLCGIYATYSNKGSSKKKRSKIDSEEFRKTNFATGHTLVFSRDEGLEALQLVVDHGRAAIIIQKVFRGHHLRVILGNLFVALRHVVQFLKEHPLYLGRNHTGKDEFQTPARMKEALTHMENVMEEVETAVTTSIHADEARQVQESSLPLQIFIAAKKKLQDEINAVQTLGGDTSRIMESRDPEEIKRFLQEHKDLDDETRRQLLDRQWNLEVQKEIVDNAVSLRVWSPTIKAKQTLNEDDPPDAFGVLQEHIEGAGLAPPGCGGTASTDEVSTTTGGEEDDNGGNDGDGAEEEANKSSSKKSKGKKVKKKVVRKKKSTKKKEAAAPSGVKKPAAVAHEWIYISPEDGYELYRNCCLIVAELMFVIAVAQKMGALALRAQQRSEGIDPDQQKGTGKAVGDTEDSRELKKFLSKHDETHDTDDLHKDLHVLVLALRKDLKDKRKHHRPGQLSDNERETILSLISMIPKDHGEDWYFPQAKSQYNGLQALLRQQSHCDFSWEQALEERKGVLDLAGARTLKELQLKKAAREAEIQSAAAAKDENVDGGDGVGGGDPEGQGKKDDGAEGTTSPGEKDVVGEKTEDGEKKEDGSPPDKDKPPAAKQDKPPDLYPELKKIFDAAKDDMTLVLVAEETDNDQEVKNLASYLDTAFEPCVEFMKDVHAGEHEDKKKELEERKKEIEAEKERRRLAKEEAARKEKELAEKEKKHAEDEKKLLGEGEGKKTGEGAEGGGGLCDCLFGNRAADADDREWKEGGDGGGGQEGTGAPEQEGAGAPEQEGAGAPEVEGKEVEPSDDQVQHKVRGSTEGG